MVVHRLRWKCNSSCVLSRLGNKSFKFYIISSVLNKSMQKNSLALFFFGHSVYNVHVCSKLMGS